MSSDLLTPLLPLVGLVGIDDIITLYAAYLALSVWKGLAVPVYKRRALWMALLAILFALISTLSTFTNSFVIYVVLSTLFLGVLFGWIGITISTLIRLDYLRRDLLGWKRIRVLYWGFAIGTLVLNAGSPSTTSVAPLDSPLLDLLLIMVFFPFVYASVVLIMGSTRTGDMTFRSHVKWGGYCLLAIVLSGVVYFATPNPVLESLPLPLISYCLYKMAKLLVPAGTFQTS
jgi:hypothetical protein